MLVGTETPPALMKSTLLAIAAIPRAQTRVLAGHGHLALLTDPAMVAALVRAFVEDPVAG